LLRGLGRFGGFFRIIPGGYPGGFCFSLDSADRLAIHPEHPFNLALGLARIQQRLDRNPQIWLQDVHSRPLFPQKKGRSVTSRRRSLARRRPASIYGIRVGDFDPATGGGSWPAAGARAPAS
jgi:hypothetical protein